MKTVKVRQQELLKALRENKDKHVAEFNDTMAGWRTATARQLRENASGVADGTVTFPVIGIESAPESHETDYDQVIRMVEMSADTIIELDNREFAQYVMDEWHWKHEHLLKSATYGSTAGRGR